MANGISCPKLPPSAIIRDCRSISRMVATSAMLRCCRKPRKSLALLGGIKFSRSRLRRSSFSTAVAFSVSNSSFFAFQYWFVPSMFSWDMLLTRSRVSKPHITVLV